MAQRSACETSAEPLLAGLSSKYLRVEELRWLKNLFFASRRIVEGRYAGRHCSRQRGHSVEFNDYRPYMQGDEPSDIDWKIYARSDRLYVKLFEQQSDMSVNILVDASASMSYSGIDGQGVSKYDHACRMAAAIAFLAVKQQDRTSLALARDGMHSFLRPQGSFRHFCDMLREMEGTEPTGRADLPVALREVVRRTRRRGLLVVFTDMLDDPKAILEALSIFTHRGGEVIVFQVLHDDELNLPDVPEAVFVDSETNERLGLNVPDIRRAYARKLDAFLDLCGSLCRGRGIDYNLVPVSKSYVDALRDYLLRRASTA